MFYRYLQLQFIVIYNIYSGTIDVDKNVYVFFEGDHNLSIIMYICYCLTILKYIQQNYMHLYVPESGKYVRFNSSNPLVYILKCLWARH